MTSSDHAALFLAAAHGLSDRVVSLDSSMALFPGGRNGPYFDLESPIRNSSHALATMAIAHHVTGDERFAEQGRGLTAFLVSDDSFVVSGSHVHRQKPHKDWCNGVIGPAWVIEALALAARCLQDQTAEEAAARLAAAQTFDHGAALWRKNNPSDRSTGIDRTLNHQVAFAVAMQSGSTSEDRAVTAFLDHLADGGLRVSESGLLVHHIPRRDEVARPVAALKEQLLRTAANSGTLSRIRRRGSRGHDHRERDTGYHLYSLFCLGRLALLRPEHHLWSGPEIARATGLAAEPAWLESLRANRYAYPYNGPGLELPLISVAFSHVQPRLVQAQARAVEAQVELTWDKEQRAFGRGTPDRLTLMARVFELGLSLLPAR